MPSARPIEIAPSLTAPAPACMAGIEGASEGAEEGREEAGEAGGGGALSLSPAMADCLREAADIAVMPRFRRLAAGDIEDKAPGEPVTPADREAERLIAARLSRLRPAARFVGEEACARDPALLRGLARGEAWIVDPIDGTANYAAGRRPFALMAALLREGETVAASILDPLCGEAINAERGRGAWVSGERIGAGGKRRALASCTGIVSGLERPAVMEARIARLGQQVRALVPTRRCAGAEYPAVACGRVDFALYWRTLAWDHAPGALIVREAGGVVARLDGTPFRPADPGGGVLVARSRAIWDQVAAMLGE